MTALGMPTDAVGDILQTLESIPNPSDAVQDQIIMLRSAVSESNAALEKVNRQIQRVCNDGHLSDMDKINLSVTILPVVFVTVSCHGSTGLDATVRSMSETLSENLQFSVTPLFGDYSGRRLNVNHAIYCG